MLRIFSHKFIGMCKFKILKIKSRRNLTAYKGPFAPCDFRREPISRNDDMGVAFMSRIVQSTTS